MTNFSIKTAARPKFMPPAYPREKYTRAGSAARGLSSCHG
jgi:hypothetical protein